MSSSRVLVYVLRRDLRLADNPIFHEISKLSKQSQRPFTHLLPVYVFPAQQVEVSGFLSSADERCPFPEARSQTGGFWRCGPLRAKFLAESVWDLKSSLERVGSGLTIQVGMVGQIVTELLRHFKSSEDFDIHGVWMTSEEGVEEKREERDVRRAVEEAGKEFKLWKDEKYFIDDRDVPLGKPSALPDVFTSYRKSVEPLRDAPRNVLPTPQSLPPPPSSIPPQPSPFTIPSTLESLISCLIAPLQSKPMLKDPPPCPSNTQSAHPFQGGSATGHDRLAHLISSGAMTGYKDSRNGLLGTDFSTKLSAWLALGCVTARQVHAELLRFEDGCNDEWKGVQGYGKGENSGTAAVRFELLWRDYMRLCTRKFGPRLFRVSGFRGDENYPWKTPGKEHVNGNDRLHENGNGTGNGHCNGNGHINGNGHGNGVVNGNSHVNGNGVRVVSTQEKVERFLNGTTGTGLIDASQRELFHTGYTSNRARQNVASYLAKHLGINWKIGAEWYECMLIDYDVSSNWGNWQYVAGVGNDPRGEARVFNPIKQACDYDPQGEYVMAWVPELRGLEDVQVVFQAWKMDEQERQRRGLDGVAWVEHPLKKIDFRVGSGRRGGGGPGGQGGGGGGGKYGGSSRAKANGAGEAGRGKGGGSFGPKSGYRGRGRGEKARGQARQGMMDKANANGNGNGYANDNGNTNGHPNGNGTTNGNGNGYGHANGHY